MKKVILLVLFLSLAAGLIVSGCGRNSGTTIIVSPSGGQTSVTSQTTTVTETTTTTSSSQGGLSWNDVPIYPGSDSIHKGSWSIPPTEGEYAQVEWRYYETGGSLDDVANYYESQMPDNGWNSVANVNTPALKYFFYNKNDENDAAMVWVSTQDNKTVFALMRASK